MGAGASPGVCAAPVCLSVHSAGNGRNGESVPVLASRLGSFRRAFRHRFRLVWRHSRALSPHVIAGFETAQGTLYACAGLIGGITGDSGKNGGHSCGKWRPRRRVSCGFDSGCAHTCRSGAAALDSVTLDSMTIAAIYLPRVGAKTSETIKASKTIVFPIQDVEVASGNFAVLT